jgi:hypothetical protein
MAQIWAELYDCAKHQDRMLGVPGIPSRGPVPQSLETHRVYFVRVCSFTFEFHSIQQIRECLAFFSRKVRPSSRASLAGLCPGFEHWEAQRWFDRLPMRLLEERRRVPIAQALSQALERFGGRGEGPPIKNAR